MTIFVIAVGIWALVEMGYALGIVAGGVPRTVPTKLYACHAAVWAILAAGALAALLV